MKKHVNSGILSGILIAIAFVGIVSLPLPGHEPEPGGDTTTINGGSCTLEGEASWIVKKYHSGWEYSNKSSHYDIKYDYTSCEACDLSIVIEYNFWLAGINKFHVSNGDAVRRIDELTINGCANDGKWKWQRYHATIARGREQSFGQGGSWRHTWQYELMEKPRTTRAGTASRFLLVMPNGACRQFYPGERPETWAPDPAFKDKFVATATGFEITLENGAMLRFARMKLGEPRDTYRLVEAEATDGLVTKLDYNSRGLLVKVTEPAGHWYKLDYQEQPFPAAQWVRFASIKNAPKPGQWLEIEVPAAQSAVSHDKVWLCGSPGKVGKPSALRIAEVEFYSDEPQPLKGLVLGTGKTPEKAFDGNVETGFKGDSKVENALVLSLGANNSKPIRKIRILTEVGAESDLAGATFAGLVRGFETRPVISRVTASDGRKVDYVYETVTNPITEYSYSVLARAIYGDGTEACYTYAQQSLTAQPSLVVADDPRYSEGAKKIRYTYHDLTEVEENGVIHEELDPDTGKIYASFELDSKDTTRREVRYMDGKVSRYTVPENTFGRPAEYVDIHGRVSRYNYANGGKGRLESLVDVKGVRTDYSYNEAGGLLGATRSDGKVKRQSWSEDKRVKSISTESGREGVYSHDAKGRLVKAKEMTGVEREFRYDAMGRVTAFHNRDGKLYKMTYNNAGYCDSITDDTGITLSLTYNTYGEVKTMRHPSEGETQHEYNERGLVTKTVFPDGKTERLTYDKYGRVSSWIARDGKTGKNMYDSLSRLVSTTDEKGEVTRFEYADVASACSSCGISEKPTAIYKPDGSITRRTYDADGYLMQEITNAGTKSEVVTTYTRDDSGRPTQVVYGSDITKYTYDDLGRKTSMTSKNGVTKLWNYDEKGRAEMITKDL